MMNKEEIKKMIKNCIYSEDGITYISNEQFNNYMDNIRDLLQENKQLKERINEAIEYCECHFKTMVADEEAQEVIEILKGVK